MSWAKARVSATVACATSDSGTGMPRIKYDTETAFATLMNAPMRIWLCVLGVAVTIVHPTVRAERLPLRNYRSTDGLPHDRIKSIFRDSRGFLWFCTVGGLGRFDGHHFVRYGVDDG